MCTAQVGEDPTEPHRSGPYPYSAISHEPRIQQLSEDFALHGLKPFHTPLGVMLDEKNPQKSPCIRCSTCDGFPCLVNAKADAHICCVVPALALPECHAADRHQSDASAHERIRARSHGGRSRTQWTEGDLFGAASSLSPVARSILRRSCCAQRTTNIRAAWQMARMSSDATTWAT